jgi:adenylate cyclase
MAPEPGPPTPSDIERLILGGDPEFTAAEVAERIGSELGDARRVWRALGFPELDPDTRMFTRVDAEALDQVRGAIASGLIDRDTAVNLTRAVGQTMARLADWEVATMGPLVEEIEAGPWATGSRSGATRRLLEQLGEPFETLLIYAWRRHLAAAVARAEASRAAEEEGPGGTDVTVGFADIVAFTALSNEIGESRVGDLIEIFESRCHDVVATHQGRVIKSLGDSVLFVVDDAVRGLDIADGIIQVIGRDGRMPDVRVGLASGPVAMRLGDVFGPAVNMAARLTGVARRNRVIIDETTADRLPEDRFEVRRLPARPVRGFGIVEPIAVRRL